MLAEQKLWAAVLTCAIHDLADADAGSPSIMRSYRQQAARDWFLSDDYYPGSVNWICDQVALDAGALRRQLLVDRARPLLKRAPCFSKGSAEIVAPGAIVREVFGGFSSEKKQGGF